MDLRLTGAHIDNIAYNQEVAIRPQEPMEWDPHTLAQFHQNGQLDASCFGLIHGSAPDGEHAPLLTAYKPLAPSLKVLDDVQHAIRDGMSPLWLAGMPFAAVIGDRRLPPWKRAMMATALLATTLYACSPVVPNNPGAPTPHGTLPPPGSTAELGPTLSAAQETGAMMAQTQEGRAFYDALTTHGVDATACSPDVLGNLVVEKNLPLETVIGLTTIATDALANTPEPDHLKAMVCDTVPGANGTQTVEFYFSSDRDFTGDGKPDIFIPSQAKVLLPGQLVDGVPEVVTPVVEGQPPAGSPVVAPNWSAAGGEIPAEIRGLMTVEEQSIRASLAAQGIDPSSVSIHDVFRGSGNDFRMGSGVTNLAQTIAFYPKFDDNTDGFAWRPDLRLADRPWHWQSVSLPEGVNGKIEVVFDPKSEAPQFVAVTPDESYMMGWFNNLTGQWLTKDGNELTQALASTATLPAPTPAPATETPAPSATPVELMPTSCLDKGEVQKVVDSYMGLENHKNQKDLIEALQAHVDKYGEGNIIYGGNPEGTAAIGVGFTNVPLLGEFKITVEGGYAYCSIFAVPHVQNGKVQSVDTYAVLTDGEINGVYSGALFNGYLGDESTARTWIQDHITSGKPISAGFGVTVDPKKKMPDAFAYKSRGVLQGIVKASYAYRFGGNLSLLKAITSPIMPDPVKIEKSLPSSEIGLIATGFNETP